MTKRRSIVISGDLGSGKTTVSLKLATLLGLRRVSMGDVYRDIAQARGMSTLQLNLHAEHDEAVDDRVDQLQAEMAASGEQLVVDSRLGWFFFPDAFKVNLIVDPVAAASRVMSRPASDVEEYSSVAEAVERLHIRSESERTRFLSKYGVDKAHLRNYDMVIDTTSARSEEITADIEAAYNGEFDDEVLSHSPPLVLLDPARIYPSQGISGLRGLWDSGFVEDVREKGHRNIEPISIARAGEYFYVVDGHRRLSAALQNGFPLVMARLIAEDGEDVIPGLSAQQYFEAEMGLSAVYDWEAAHKVELPLPPHLTSLARARRREEGSQR